MQNLSIYFCVYSRRLPREERRDGVAQTDWGRDRKQAHFVFTGAYRSVFGCPRATGVAAEQVLVQRAFTDAEVGEFDPIRRRAGVGCCDVNVLRDRRALCT